LKVILPVLGRKFDVATAASEVRIRDFDNQKILWEHMPADYLLHQTLSTQPLKNA